ncbi:hypothetical protein ACDW_43280 (plasmid) [Acidovorax sp. DW039]|uniref:hypothetical protein n=1 Tax=Acidovorax sp. DW039 TaxID=3095606 RepID=UPI00308CE8B0|nr:hypothetical protein ACDW_43280 [Acidovorax sp. DW039]
MDNICRGVETFNLSLSHTTASRSVVPIGNVPSASLVVTPPIVSDSGRGMAALAEVRLKQEVKTLNTQMRTLTKQLAKLEEMVQSQQPVKDPRVPRSTAGFVFNHEALIAKRHELGLTQAQMTQLLGVSSLTAYKWETVAVHPRDKKFGLLQEVRKTGPR